MMIENCSSSGKGYNHESSNQQEDENGTMKFSNKAIATSRQWTSLRNPRIVRVSRSLGGKDRHSKVCTIRGLRDRRIRLSVPTAIQLYDLQDRLGLSQPSKVVDWLLEATQSDIDKLPPLQNIPQCFTTQPQTLLHQQGNFSLGSGFYDHQIKGKEAEISYNTNYSSNAFPYNLDYPSSTLSLSQFGNNNNHGNLFGSSSGMKFSSGNSSQLLFCPNSNSAMPSSLFSSSSTNLQQHAPSMEISSDVQRQFTNVQILNSSSTSSFIPSLQLPINSPFRRLPMPFINSKVLDSDHNNTRN
ncbi:unnamed protein product [Trifolium pratense]|nr:unnamed protein product [Trifolium pratense]